MSTKKFRNTHTVRSHFRSRFMHSRAISCTAEDLHRGSERKSLKHSGHGTEDSLSHSSMMDDGLHNLTTVALVACRGATEACRPAQMKPGACGALSLIISIGSEWSHAQVVDGTTLNGAVVPHSIACDLYADNFSV